MCVHIHSMYTCCTNEKQASNQTTHPPNQPTKLTNKLASQPTNQPMQERTN